MKILNVDAFFETSTLIRLFAASNSWFKTLRTRMSKDLGDSIFSYNSGGLKKMLGINYDFYWSLP